MSETPSTSSLVDLPFVSTNGNISLSSTQSDQVMYNEVKYVNDSSLLFLLVIQCSLLHPAFARSRLARLVRISLTPIIFFGSIVSPFQRSSKTAEPHKSFDDLVGALFYIYVAIKSLEWGFASGPYYLRPLTVVDNVKRWQKPKEGDDSYKRAQEEEPLNVLKMVSWIFLQLTSLRGLQFTWGPSTIANTRDTFSLLWRVFRVNIPLTCALRFIVMSRDSPLGTPASALLSLGVPNFPGLNLLSETLYSACFGIWTVCALDTRYTTITLGMTIIYKLATKFGCPQHILDLCDPVNFPPLFDSPHMAPSIAHFWGKAWHSALQRSFLIGGGKPMVWFTKKIGVSSRTQKLAGLFGVFAASALLHEYLSSVWKHAQDPDLVKTSSFPGSLVFFMMQPIGILIEPHLIPLIPKKLGGGVLWVWAFLLLTAYPFRKQYLEDSGVTSILSPISEWSWLYILSPVKD